MTTPNLGMTLPTVGADDDAWGTELNTCLTIIDDFAGVVETYNHNSASGVALTTATTANIVSISLPAGDWDVSGVVQFIPSGGGAATSFSAGLTSTSATLPAFSTGALIETSAAFTPSLANALPFAPVRFSLGSTTTIYMVAQASFPSGTMTGAGFIRANRIK